MDKEIKAKVEEFVKEYGKRELSMEELDKVNGGWETLRAVNGQYYTGAEIGDLAYSMVDAFGWDVAGESICIMFGVSPNEARNIKKGGITDKGKMDILLATIGQIMDRLEKRGHSH